MTLTAEQVALELTRACPAALGHLWQATVFGVVVAGLAMASRRAPARLRHGLYLLASLKFLLPSILLLALLGQFSSHLPAFLPSWLMAALDPHRWIAFLGGILPTRGVPSATEVPQGGWIWSFLSLVWVVGTVSLVALWGRRLIAFRAVLRRGRRLDSGATRRLLEELQQRLKIRRTVALVLSDQVTEPGVWGVWKPTVALPEAMPADLEAAEMEVVLLHELVHVRRWDNLISHLHMGLCCLFWFHPLVWWLDRRLLAERERACDDRVVELSGASEVYARSLVKVLRLGLGWRLAGVSGAGGADLKGRLEHIRAGAASGGVSLSHRGVVLAAFLLLLCMSLAAVPFSPRSQGDSSPIRAVVAEEWNGYAGEPSEDTVNICLTPDDPPEPSRSQHCPRHGAGQGGAYTGGGIRTAI